ncbi:MAG: hypothetical protein ACJ76N_10105, partial [Thermoanaerobaculia bacterium]
MIDAKEAVLTLRKAAMNRIEAACCLLVAALRGLWLKRVEIGRHFEAEITPQSEAAKHYAPFSAGKKI